MFVVSGWLKEKRPIRPLHGCYCYVCQRTSRWILIRETEWVTFFGMRTIPFVNKDSICCERCVDEFELSSQEARTLLASTASAFADAVEARQLSTKTDVQRNFLLAARAGREGSA